MGTRIIADMYRDSVALMKISSAITLLNGVSQASCIMATPANLDLLREAGLITGDPGARPNEVLIAVEAETDDALIAGLDAAEAALHADPVVAESGGMASEPLRSIEMALDANVEANFTLIATPGPFAAAEAFKSVQLGLNVMMFSDNVSIEDEVALKTQADQAGLMVMGPDCGTAIIDGAPLGFANVVRRGTIGIAAASGTGLQQVSCLIDAADCGVSQAIGTGGRDLDSRVGGITTKRAITALGADPDTAVIVLISKPPAPGVATAVLEHAVATGKPVVACLLGHVPDGPGLPGVSYARTLEEAAQLAIVASGSAAASTQGGLIDGPLPGLGANQRYLRALYSGGTFCYEALTMLGETLDGVHSNTSSASTQTLNDPWTSAANTVLDLGDDLFTRGRPHPMIDHRLRNDRIVAEAQDPATGVILFDVMLGHGSHEDPVAAMVPALSEVTARDAGGPVLLGFVCGTQGDPQGLDRQRAALADLGVLLAANNAQAVRTAAAILEGAA
tara:strand:+ start:20938 stop:22458 length:1521 start_codon:yes stop_codon:yes gene_type:complete